MDADGGYPLNLSQDPATDELPTWSPDGTRVVFRSNRVKRRNHADMAIVPAAELRSLEETAHLLRSPKNAQRLLAALQRALEGSVKPKSIHDLRGEVGLE